MRILFTGLLATLILVATGCTSQTSSTASVTPAEADIDPTADTVSVEQEKPDAADANEPASEDVPAAQETPESQESVEVDLADFPESALTVGSTAPELDIEHWVSDGDGAFSKVTTFEKDKVYVVEFWATWCGPCVASMPHLVEIQEKFKDSVQVVSVSDEDIDTVSDFLKRPYEKGGEDGPTTYGELTSAYCLTTDPDGSVGEAYMRAAGQNGIPCCFVVGKSGLIEWIGHPMRLDEPLAAVVEDAWDRDAFAVDFKKEQLADLLLGQIAQAAQAGDAEKATALLAKAKAVAGPMQMRMLDSLEVQLKLMPAGKLMQAGDIEGAITAIQELVDAEGDEKMKRNLLRILDQVKAQAANEAADQDEAEEAPAATDDEA